MTPPSPADELERRLRMRADWLSEYPRNRLKDAGLMDEAIAELSALRAKLAEAMEVVRAVVQNLGDIQDGNGNEAPEIRAARRLVDGGRNG